MRALVFFGCIYEPLDLVNGEISNAPAILRQSLDGRGLGSESIPFNGFREQV